MDEPAPAERRPPKRKGIKVAVLYNVDYEDGPDGDPGYEARADVAQVAASVAEQLSDGAHEAHLVAVDGDMHRLRCTLHDLEPDCAFNLCESLAGDARLESAVPLILELLGIPFTGSAPEALSRALYKDRVKRRLEAAGVPTPPARVMVGADDPCDLPFPLIVKPVREDGSAGISSRSVVHNEEQLRALAGDLVAAFRQPCLVEQFIAGREFNVALFGYPTARVLPLSEIDFSALPPEEAQIVSYAAKWEEGSVADRGTRPVLHPQLPNSVAARVRRVAVEAFRAVGLRDYGRIDVRLSQAGVPYVVDVNPNCDLSQGAGMARATAAVGIDYRSLIHLLVRYALRRRKALVQQQGGLGTRSLGNMSGSRRAGGGTKVAESDARQLPLRVSSS
jgi:D-alanine-D-alanine ligase